MLTDTDIEVLRSCLNRLPGGTWEVWTSNSYRRITARENGRSGVDGGVLRGTVHPLDRHGDLSMSAEQLEALCDLRNTIAAVLEPSPVPRGGK